MDHYVRGKAASDLILSEDDLLRYLQLLGFMKVRVVNDTTRRMIQEEVIRGLELGLDTFDIAQTLERRWLAEAPADGPISFGRAERIARTEIAAAQNAGSLSGASESGLSFKVWSSVKDFRTRRTEQRGYDHFEDWNPDTGLGAHGQVRRIDEPFIISGEQLQFPGDPSLGAGAGSIINCRCSMTFRP
jgi:uncharacterized protein with gpF-like domain